MSCFRPREHCRSRLYEVSRGWNSHLFAATVFVQTDEPISISLTLINSSRPTTRWLSAPRDADNEKNQTDRFIDTTD